MASMSMASIGGEVPRSAEPADLPPAQPGAPEQNGAVGEVGEADVIVSVEHEFSVLLRRARAFSRELAREVHPELEADAYGLLLRIAAAGPSRPTDLATYVGVGKPTISRQIAMLETLGLVARHGVEGDARAFTLALTPAGQDRLGRARSARRANIQQRLSGWEQADLERLAELLRHFNEQGDAAARALSPSPPTPPSEGAPASDPAISEPARP